VIQLKYATDMLSALAHGPGWFEAVQTPINVLHRRKEWRREFTNPPRGHKSLTFAIYLHTRAIAGHRLNPQAAAMVMESNEPKPAILPALHASFGQISV
jgi:hypothetical protein